MKAILVIAINSFKESIRDRILYGLFLFAILLIGLSRAMGGLSFAEQERIVVDFGLAGVHISAVMLSIFIGSSLVSKELEKRTILTLLVRPLSRFQFLLGKYLGFCSIVFLLILGLSFVLFLVMGLMGIEFHITHLVSIIGVFMECCVLVAATMLFGSISKPVLTVCFVIGIFIIGHWIESLKYFANGSESQGLKLVSKLSEFFIPNLEVWNWKSVAVYQEYVSLNEFITASAHCIAWSGIFFTLALMVFRRKDCV